MHGKGWDTGDGMLWPSGRMLRVEYWGGGVERDAKCRRMRRNVCRGAGEVLVAVQNSAWARWRGWIFLTNGKRFAIGRRLAAAAAAVGDFVR